MYARSCASGLLFGFGPASLRVCDKCVRSLGLAAMPVRAARGDLKTHYEALVAAGELHFDPQQKKAVERLQRLQERLSGYQAPSPPGILGKVSVSCRSAVASTNIICPCVMMHDMMSTLIPII